MASKTLLTCDWCGAVLVDGNTNADRKIHASVSMNVRAADWSIVKSRSFDSCMDCYQKLLPKGCK